MTCHRQSRHLRSNFRSFLCFFNDTATPEIYTLSLHDALPIFREEWHLACDGLVQDHADGVEIAARVDFAATLRLLRRQDRKSTRLNSSHGYISYAVFCLKKKKIVNKPTRNPTPRNRCSLRTAH